MPVVRVYLPVGPGDLAELAERESLGATPASPRTAYTVTPELERTAPGSDVEDLEYAAFSDAVLAAGAGAGDARRVVTAVDVDPDWITTGGPGRPPGSLCAVTLVAPVPLARVASFHVDERVGSRADAGPAAHEDALLWYDATELTDVRDYFA